MIQNTIKFLPIGLRNKIAHRHGLIQILNNISWLFFDRILRMGVGLVVGVWIARFLGPEQFGLMSYVLAFVGLFTAVATLGLSEIVVRDLVQDPSAAGTTMGTALTLQVMGGLCAFGLAFLAISYVRPSDELAKFAVAVLAMLMVLKATEVVKYWFESQVQSKYTVWTESGVFIVFAAIKIGLILSKAPLMAFIWALFAEGLLIAVGLLGVYALRGGKISAWRPRFKRAKTLLKDSWPLVLSGLAIMVYMRIDQIMLGIMLGDESVGIYTAAVRISEVCYFIPMTIVASVFPAIIEVKKTSETLYYQRLQKLYDMMVLLALAVALPMTFLSEWVVTLLFGKAYLQAGSVLAIHIWAGIFVFLGVASGKWYLVENLQRLSLYRTLLGAFANIILNLMLIPHFGLIGSALATVASYAVAAYISDFFNTQTRVVFIMKTKSIFFARIYQKNISK